MYSTINVRALSSNMGMHGLGAESEEDPSVFQRLWNKIKNYIAEIKQVGPKLALHMQNLAVKKQMLLASGQPEKAGAMDIFIRKATDDFTTWNKVSNLIDEYLPKWLKASNESTGVNGLNGLGLLPIIIIGVAGMAALAYVSVEGLRLVKEYKVQEDVVQQVVEGKISSDQAQVLIANGTTGSVIGDVAKGIAPSLTPMFAIVGLGIVGLVYMKFVYKEKA